MEPIRICLENFMGHRYSDIDCTKFRSVLIVGKEKNNDLESNAVGKTTIFHAITYALYNEYPTKTIDKIIRNGCDRGKVIFEFVTSAGTFRITRSRSKKSNKGDLLLHEKRGDDWEPITCKTPTETEAEIKKLIKIPFNAFRNSVLFAQSDLNGLNGLASSDPKGRKQILKDALDLLEYAKFEKNSKEKYSELNKTVITLKGMAAAFGNPKEDILNLEKSLKDIELENEKITKEKNDIQASLAAKRIELSDLEKMINSEGVDIHNKLFEIKNDKKQLQNKLTISQKSLEEKEFKLKQHTTDLNNKIKLLGQFNDEYEALNLKPSRLLEEVKQELEKVIANENNGKAYIMTLENECTKLKKPIPDGDVCPHCRQPVSLAHKEECSKLILVECSQKEQEIIDGKNKLEAVRKKRNKLELEIKELNDRQIALLNLENRISNKKTEIQNGQNYTKQITDLATHIKTEVDSYQKNLDELCKREEILKENSKKFTLEDVSVKISKTKDDIDTLENKFQSSVESISSLNTKLGIFTERLNNRQNDAKKLDELSDEIVSKEKALFIRQQVSYGFSSNGIPNMIINTILDDLQCEANKLLHSLRPGFQLQFSVIKNKSDGQVEDTLDILYRLSDMEVDYEMLSGGQKLMVALSLKLGLSFVIQKKLGVDIKFLQLDEVDQSLDKARIDALSNIIKSWQENFKIFVITHNDRLQENFNTAILVENDGQNGSCAKVVESW